MENSKYSLPIKHKAPLTSPSSSCSPESSDQQYQRQPKRARLSSSDTSLDYSDSASSSSTSSTNLKLPVKLSTNSETIYTSPSSNPLYSKNNDTISTSMINNYQHPQTNSCHNQSQSNCSYLYQPDASNPYYYSAYDQFLANTHLSQIYSRNLIENLNYGIINENISAPFLFGNQFNYKNNAQTVPNYPYVNTYFHSQEYGV